MPAHGSSVPARDSRVEPSQKKAAWKRPIAPPCAASVGAAAALSTAAAPCDTPSENSLSDTLLAAPLACAAEPIIETTYAASSSVASSTRRSTSLAAAVMSMREPFAPRLAAVLARLDASAEAAKASASVGLVELAMRRCRRTKMLARVLGVALPSADAFFFGAFFSDAFFFEAGRTGAEAGPVLLLPAAAAFFELTFLAASADAFVAALSRQDTFFFFFFGVVAAGAVGVVAPALVLALVVPLVVGFEPELAGRLDLPASGAPDAGSLLARSAAFFASSFAFAARASFLRFAAAAASSLARSVCFLGELAASSTSADASAPRAVFPEAGPLSAAVLVFAVVTLAAGLVARANALLE